jgi:cytochrome P450
MDAEASLARTEPAGATFAHRFQPETLRGTTFWQRKLRWSFEHAEWFLRPMRFLGVNPTISGAKWLLRYDDVQEVLTRHDVFAVPYAERIKAVDRTGQNFILGMEDDGASSYRDVLARVMRAMRREDLARVGLIAHAFSTRLLRARPPEIEVVGSLFIAATVEVVERYFGVPITASGEDEAERRHNFALWPLALSNYVFAASSDDASREAALAAGERLGAAIDRGISEARARLDAPIKVADQTLADRLVADFAERHSADPDEAFQTALRPTLSGLMTGFVPGCTIAATNILNLLLDRPEMMKRCRDAARVGDDATLGRHLLEVFRFRPLFPGPERICQRDYRLGSGVRLKANQRVRACTQSAMFDSAHVLRPRTFDPARAASDSMQFGFGPHACVGAALATTVLVNTLRPLLAGFRPVRVTGPRGAAAWLRWYPERMLIKLEA